MTSMLKCLSIIGLGSFILLQTACVQKIPLKAPELCALRFNMVEDQDPASRFLLAEHNRTRDSLMWRYNCGKPRTEEHRCLVQKYNRSGFEKEQYNRWHDHNKIYRILLELPIVTIPFVEWYFYSKRSAAKKRAKKQFYSACIKPPQ